MNSFKIIGRCVFNALGSQNNRVSPHQIFCCDYKKKTAEEILGIEKPKKPIPPFFKFMTHMKPALLAKKPGMSVPEAHKWGGKHWRELDRETKSQMSQEYEKEKEIFKIKMEQYAATLTEEQKADIKQFKEKLKAKKKKKKNKEESYILGKPKRPPSAYLLFIQVNKSRYKGKWGKDLQEQAKSEWNCLSAEARTLLEKQAQDLLTKYKKEIQEWKLKAISIGRTDLVVINKSLVEKLHKKVNKFNKSPNKSISINNNVETSDK